MEKEQQQRSKEAVERQSRDAEAASRESQQAGQDKGAIQGDQESLRSPSQSQDTLSARDKNSRHKKVTADKWNQ